jgi:hypothetical protein
MLPHPAVPPQLQFRSARWNVAKRQSSLANAGSLASLAADLWRSHSLIQHSSPPTLGYAMPAEWERHEATWLGWPHNETDWPGKLDTIRWVYGEMVRKISAGEIVRLLVRHRTEERLARQYLSRAGCDLDRVEFIVHPTNRGWTRDSGPICVRRRRPDAGRGHRPLSLQRLGQVRRLATRHPCARNRGPPPRQASLRGPVPGPGLRARGRRHRGQRRRHPAHHRGVLPRSRESRSATPASPAPTTTPRSRPTSGSRTSCGSATVPWATTPTATSTTSAAS